MIVSRGMLALVALAVVGLAAAPSAAEEKPVVIRFGHCFAVDHPFHLGALRFAETVSAKTKDRIQVKVFPACQLGSATAQFGNVRMGTQEMFIETGSLASRIQPEFLVFVVPFLLKSQDQAERLYAGPIYREMTEKLVKSHGVRVVASNWDRSHRYLLTKVPVSKLSDLKGLKIRVPANPLFMKAWKALGASPVPMEIPDIYLGLQQGAIEGVEMPVDALYTSKYHEAAKYVTLTNHLIEECAGFVNEKFFQTLSASDRQGIQDALVEAGEYHNRILREKVKEFVEQMKRGGVRFIEMPEAERERWAAITERVALDEEASGKWPKGLIARIRKEVTRP